LNIAIKPNEKPVTANDFVVPDIKSKYQAQMNTTFNT
jgi:hypothetical protein